MDKHRRALLRAENRLFPPYLVQLPREKWEKVSTDPGNAGRIAVWRSRDFLAQIFNEGSGRIRITVNRSEPTKDGNWKDGITWDELMDIKKQVGYGDNVGVEVYPPERDIVNVANMRHIYIFLDGLPCWPNRIPVWTKAANTEEEAQ